MILKVFDLIFKFSKTVWTQLKCFQVSTIIYNTIGILPCSMSINCYVLTPCTSAANVSCWAILYWNVPYDMQNFATFSSLVTMYMYMYIKRNEVVFHCHAKYYGKVIWSNSQLEWFILFLWLLQLEWFIFFLWERW